MGQIVNGCCCCSQTTRKLNDPIYYPMKTEERDNAFNELYNDPKGGDDIIYERIYKLFKGNQLAKELNPNFLKWLADSKGNENPVNITENL